MSRQKNYLTLFVMSTLLLHCGTPNKDYISILLPGIISTEAVEYDIALSNSGDTIYFVRHNGNWGSPSNPPSNIYTTVFREGSWQAPQLAWFSSEEYNDSDISINNNTILFTSNRPHKNKIGKGGDIWKIEKQRGQWSEPEPLSKVVNSEYGESSAVLDGKGNLYFTSMRDRGKGLGDIYFASKNKDGSYHQVEIVDSVSSIYGEWNVFVNEEGSLMLLECSGRPDARSDYGDLYYSLKNNGVWRTPKPLDIVNTTGSDLNITLSPDEEHFYFASSQLLESRNVDLFKIPAKDVYDFIKADK